MSLNWAFTLQLWMVADGAVLALSFAGVDAATALALYLMSAGRWFPAPLALLHGALALYHLCTVFIGPERYWVVLLLNRLFEAEILYVAGCGVYR
ncbi:MAG: hypothetical protein KAH44_29315, partial [Oricola sp.]|nr:hypothetical protein [Oricola sp.]